MGIYVTGIMLYVLIAQQNTDHAVEMVLCLLHVLVDRNALLVAGVAFWRGLLRAGLIATVADVLACPHG